MQIANLITNANEYAKVNAHKYPNTYANVSNSKFIYKNKRKIKRKYRCKYKHKGDYKCKCECKHQSKECKRKEKLIGKDKCKC